MVVRCRHSISPILSSILQFRQYTLKVCRTIEEIRQERNKISSKSKVGLVPTMGGLHLGHKSLVKLAKEQTDVVIASVFVNPKQFGPKEDFSSYPRSFHQDLKVLEDLKVDLVYAPTTEEMYLPHHQIFVDPVGFDNISEGIIRPGFFRGVATVVTKLFNIINPTHTYFGQKDAVQCVLIKRILQDLNFPIQLVIGETIREKDGLALSTRNQYMSTEERAAASIVFKGLQALKQVYESSTGPVLSECLRDAARQCYLQEKLVKEIQYISISSKETMKEIECLKRSDGAIASVAIKLGNVRLIDNVIL